MQITRILFAFILVAFGTTSLLAQEYGVASYYSDKFQGKPTASGELYDKDKYTAAHKEYAFGTIIKVTRLDNKKSVKVRVTDRGPYVNGRIVDLSRRAAESLDLVDAGTARVKVEVVESVEESATTEPDPVVIRPPASANEPIEEPNEVVTARPQPMPPSTQPAPRAEEEETASSSTTTREESDPTPAPQPERETNPGPPPATPASAELLTTENLEPYGLFHVRMEKPAVVGYAVQVGSMTNYTNVMRLVAELQGKWFKNILLSIEPGENGEPVYKVLLGPFDSQKSASAYKSSVKSKTGIQGFVVNLKEINYQP